MLTKANDLKLKGQDIIHMDVGEPGASTPKHILKYAKEIIGKKKIGYTESIGIPELGIMFLNIISFGIIKK